MKRYMLDTNICIYLIKKKSPQIFQKLSTLQIGQICISAITYSELEFGVSNSSNSTKNRQALNEFLSPVDILDYPSSASPIYGELRTNLKRKGTPIGANDMLIAAHAMASDLTLVTNNEKEFARIEKLSLENWV